MALRITLISEVQRTAPRVFDTDDPGEAVTQFVANWREKPDGPWAFCLVIEQEDDPEERMGYRGFSDWLRRLLSLEHVREFR